MSLVFDNPVQPVLAMPPDLAVWQQCEAQSDAAGRWRNYLHKIGWTALRPWFQEEFDQPVALWPTADPSDIWQGVDGLALMLGQQRILIMLSETIDAATLQVPQEWVDIPGWAADYYLAAHVDVDEQRLALWGYATYAQVKAQGRYEPSDRTYSLSDVDVIHDFSVFWVAQQMEQPQAISTPALPPLSAAQAEGLIEQLAVVVEPRLEIPFEQWGALLSDARWRQQLWQQRRGIEPVDLGRWFNQLFEPGWRSLESLLPQTPALEFRSGAPSGIAVIRSKLIVLNATRDQLVLVLRVAPVEGAGDASPLGNLRSISVQLFPSGAALLPRGVTLTLELTSTAEPLQTVQAGGHDNYIQLPRFRCPERQQFRLTIQLADAIYREDFVS